MLRAFWVKPDTFSTGMEKFVHFLEMAGTRTKFWSGRTSYFMRNSSAELLGSPQRARPQQHALSIVGIRTKQQPQQGEDSASAPQTRETDDKKHFVVSGCRPVAWMTFIRLHPHMMPMSIRRETSTTQSPANNRKWILFAVNVFMLSHCFVQLILKMIHSFLRRSPLTAPTSNRPITHIVHRYEMKKMCSPDDLSRTSCENSQSRAASKERRH